MIKGTRIPPSVKRFFSPLNGVFNDPSHPEVTGPFSLLSMRKGAPLSLIKNIIVLSVIPLVFSVSMIVPTPSSIADIIANAC